MNSDTRLTVRRKPKVSSFLLAKKNKSFFRKMDFSFAVEIFFGVFQ
jgi:hypothetical protein